MSARKLGVGDRVTVRTSDADQLELCLHRHAVVTEVRPVDDPQDPAHPAGGVAYMVGHPWGSDRRYGPYPEGRLIHGWDAP